MMEIYLLRHGQSTSNPLRIVCGATDYPLSKTGKKQAQIVCRFLEKLNFTKVYCSPLSRARDTLAPLGQLSGVIIEDDLVELDTGTFSSLTVDELWSRDPRYKNQGVYSSLKYPDGESLDDMLSRIGNWLERRLQEWENEDIVLVSGHEGTVCAILHKLLNLSSINYPTFIIGNCDIVRISIDIENQIRFQFFPISSIENEECLK